jgi:hypothetical protein
MMYRQFDLRSGWVTYTTVWLEDDPRLKEGAHVTTKETGDTLWTVVKRYNTLREQKDLHAKQKWQVGGLV